MADAHPPSSRDAVPQRPLRSGFGSFVGWISSELSGIRVPGRRICLLAKGSGTDKIRGSGGRRWLGRVVIAEVGEVLRADFRSLGLGFGAGEPWVGGQYLGADVAPSTGGHGLTVEGQHGE